MKISKKLAKILRHDAESLKLPIDEKGYVPVDLILKMNFFKSLNVDLEHLKKIVETNKKQRFNLKFDNDKKVYLICANQGHSIKKIQNSNLIQLKNYPDDFPDFIIHGTFKSKWPLIKESGGLKKMNRNHIHLTTNLPNSENNFVISGMKTSSNVFIYINIKKCLDNNIIFHKSLNNVILTEGNKDGIIPLDCFERVIDKNDNPLDF
ncbi:tRNA 2'-phosphotransferase [Ascoidea rubescens DSM 1968]|uniref:2'-phosphotransferase n=1 Tax=Ascoidea rubescens DSM 1968 TaxID=1344418 RepID=A0A1D2V9I0_9ASCO|nr:phosphotransferase KptA/Tpt1 [Ascoidea rubescens DSM 1968]ODV58229.1 phosphotransferase KptA/Tpt1 [Ascoidea rubescens DSM 1968]